MTVLRDFFKYHGFWSLLGDTRTLSELYRSKNALGAGLISAITVALLFFFFLHQGKDDALNALLKNLLPGFAAGLIGLFGFLISGLAVLTGMISSRVVAFMDDQKKSHALMELLFSFYFEGAIIGACILGLFLTYIVIYIDQATIVWLFVGWGFVLAYIFWFSILYGIGLIGTCINIFFLNVQYEMELEKDSKGKPTGSAVPAEEQIPDQIFHKESVGG